MMARLICCSRQMRCSTPSWSTLRSVYWEYSWKGKRQVHISHMTTAKLYTSQRSSNWICRASITSGGIHCHVLSIPDSSQPRRLLSPKSPILAITCPSSECVSERRPSTNEEVRKMLGERRSLCTTGGDSECR